MKSLMRIVRSLGVVLILIAGIFFLGPRVLYLLPPFQSWVSGQIEKQSGGKFSFDSISGDAFEARLGGACLDMESTRSNVFQAQFKALRASFELLPVAMFKLDLKDLRATGGEVILNLRGGEYESIRMPVSAETLAMEEGRLVIRNLEGYECVLEGCRLFVQATGQGIKGEFQAERGKAGVVDLTDISGNYEFGKDGLRVSSFSATIPGESALSLEGVIVLKDEGTAIRDAVLHVKTDQVKALLTGLGYSERFEGSADVNARFSGSFRPEVKDLTGDGKVLLTGIRARVDLPSYPGFDGSGILADLKEITGLEGVAPFTLSGDRINVSPLSLENEKMKVEGELVVGYDKMIRGKQILLACPELAAGIPGVARNVFKKNESGWTVIPFSFVGTTNAPSANAGSVVSKALMNPVNSVKGVGGILGGLFGGGEKGGNEKPSAE